MPAMPSAVVSVFVTVLRQAGSSAQASRVSQPSGGTHVAGRASTKLKGRKRTVSAQQHVDAADPVHCLLIWCNVGAAASIEPQGLQHVHANTSWLPIQGQQ